MVDKITGEQYQDLLDAIDERNINDIINTFDRHTGIVAKPYTGYQFYDAVGNYLGDLEYDTVLEILKDAGIEVAEDG